jgi:hypothetical protein
MQTPGVSAATLCPLGQPNKAVGHESRIGPWLACFANPSSLSSFRNRRIKTIGGHETIARSYVGPPLRGGPKRSRPTAQLNERGAGWRENIRGFRRRKKCLLTSPFIGQSDSRVMLPVLPSFRDQPSDPLPLAALSYPKARCMPLALGQTAFGVHDRCRDRWSDAGARGPLAAATRHGCALDCL